MTKVSIQMCTYNRAQYITQSIESVLIQTFNDWELIILDDASTDDTEELLKKYTLKDNRIKYYKNNINIGITKNRNKALSISNGEYITILDSDDIWIDKNKLQKQVDFLDKNKTYCLVGTQINIIDSNDNIIKYIQYPTSNHILKHFLLLKNFFCHSSVMYRKQEIIGLGSYDESFFIWEDYELWLKIGTNYKIKNLSIIGTSYRIHSSQSSMKKTIQTQEAQKAIIDKYKYNYPYYYLAVLLNKLRNLKQNLYVTTNK